MKLFLVGGNKKGQKSLTAEHAANRPLPLALRKSAEGENNGLVPGKNGNNVQQPAVHGLYFYLDRGYCFPLPRTFARGLSPKMGVALNSVHKRLQPNIQRLQANMQRPQANIQRLQFSASMPKVKLGLGGGWVKGRGFKMYQLG